MLLVNTSTFLLTALVINLIIYYLMSYTLQLLVRSAKCFDPKCVCLILYPSTSARHLFILLVNNFSLLMFFFVLISPWRESAPLHQLVLAN